MLLRLRWVVPGICASADKYFRANIDASWSSMEGVNESAPVAIQQPSPSSSSSRSSSSRRNIQAVK